MTLKIPAQKTYLATLVQAISLGAMMSLAAPQFSYANPVAGQNTSMSYNIPAQELGFVLSSFAVESGIVLSFDSALTQGIQSAGLQGRYTVDQALDQLLNGTSLVALKQGNSYSIARATANQGNSAKTGPMLDLQGQLPTITATAENSRDWAYQQTRAVSVIDRRDIDTRPVLHVADILKDTPGVYSAVNRQDPGVSVNIRGIQDFGRVNTMVDGMRQNHVKLGHQQRNGQMYIDPEFISNVVIEKGPRSGVNGATALAGSANFRTVDFDDVIFSGNDYGVRIRANTGLGDKYDGNLRFQGSTAVAGNLGQNNQLQLLYAHAYNKQGDTRVGQHGQSNTISGHNSDIVNRTGEEIKVLNDSGRRQQSNLFKAKYHFDEKQSLQLSYIETEYDYSNMADQINANALTTGNPANESIWKRNGDSNLKTQSYALDYQNHANAWLNLNAKLYHVKTESKDAAYSPRSNLRSEQRWRNGVCLNPALEPRTSLQSIMTSCALGYDRYTQVSTKTTGFQLDNTSNFSILGVAGFSANYGAEYFKDDIDNSAPTIMRDGLVYDVEQNLFNGVGKRDVGSLFSSLNYSADGHHLEAGLRYDYSKLKGNTRMTTYEMSFGPSDTNQNVFFWRSQPVVTPVKVDKDWHAFLPSVSGSIRVYDGWDIFTSWGKSWRPPAVVETLFEGGHAGDSFSRMYPNPYLKPERSESLEVGFNYNKQGLLRPNDKFNSKLSYYDTQIKNFTVTNVVATLPGATGNLGRSLYVQNQIKTPFKGLELDLSYDADVWYTRLNYNHVIGGDNKFCLMEYPLGSGRPDDYGITGLPGRVPQGQPILEEALRAGFPNVRSYLDTFMQCSVGVPGILNSARSMPTDKGSFVLGTRLFDQKLDMGLRVSYSEKGGARYDYDYITPTRQNGSLEVGSAKQPNSEVWKTTTIYDAYISYILNKNITLRGSVENIRDKSYFSNFADTLSLTYSPGRTYVGGVEFRF